MKHAFVIHLLTDLLHSHKTQIEEAGSAGNMQRHRTLKENSSKIVAAISALELASAADPDSVLGNLNPEAHHA
jgi:hypothetical protein